MAQPDPRGERPVLLDLDAGTWTATRDRVRPWLAATGMLQQTFRRRADGVADAVAEPHIRAALRDVADTARRHEAVARDLYPAFGVAVPGRAPVYAAAAIVTAAGREAAAQLVGRLGGAHGRAWRGMRELLRGNLDAIGGFAVVEQLGLSLGTPRVVDLVFPVLTEKRAQQLQLQEFLLETAANSVLFQRDA